METLTQSPLRFTPGAVTELKKIMNDPAFDSSQYLRIGVKGGGCSGLSYVLGFDQRSEKDTLYQDGDIPFIMERAHEIYLYGMEIDWQGGLNSRGFTFTNPNASSTCGCGTSFAV